MLTLSPSEAHKMTSLATQLILLLLAYYLIRHLFAVLHAYFVSPMRVLPTAHKLVLFPSYGFLKDLERIKFLLIEDYHLHWAKVVRLGPSLVSIADPLLARRVIKIDDLAKSPIYNSSIAPSMVPSVFNATNREYHRMRRKLHSLSFSTKYLSGLEPAMQAAYDAFERATLEKIKHSSTGTEITINAFQAFGAITNDVIGITSLGQSFNSVAMDEEHPFVHHSAQILLACVLWYLFPFTQTYHPLLPATKSIDFIRRFITGVVKERKEHMARNPGAVPQDILQNLIVAQDPDSGKGFSDEDVIAEVLTLLTAGAGKIARRRFCSHN